jgi:hypothetical protein
VALGVELDARPFQKSVLQEFRARLILHEQQQAVFDASLAFAKRQGYFEGKKQLKIALDTTAILGRGAVKDTYQLLADGIVQVMCSSRSWPVKSWSPGQNGKVSSAT